MMTAMRPWPHADSPFHAGSLRIQQQLGIAERMDAQGRRAVSAVLTEQHAAFFVQLPFVVVAGVDASGQPWASLLFGEAGFMRADTPARLTIRAAPLPGDPLCDRFVHGAAIGLLGIDLATRRRNRVNGHIGAAAPGAFTVHVAQAFGNCPKYIRRRFSRRAAPVGAAARHLQVLDDAARRMIGAAETMFIATSHGAGADASHRGGKPGFVKVDANGTLTLPDFTGNAHFRTIGSLLDQPRAGLLFADFTSGDLLYVAVEVEIIQNGAELDAFDGAQRLLRCRVQHAIRLPAAMPMRFDDADSSPFLDTTGQWPLP